MTMSPMELVGHQGTKAGPPTLLHIVSLEYLHTFSLENKRIFIVESLEEEQQVKLYFQGFA
jgi:hypothetical protein